MRRTRWTTVLACLTCSAAVTWVTLDLILRHRGWVPLLTAWTALVALGVSVVVLIAGLGVRRLRAHERTWMTPLGAAVTAAAAQASALVWAGQRAGSPRPWNWVMSPPGAAASWLVAGGLLALASAVVVLGGRAPGRWGRSSCQAR